MEKTHNPIKQLIRIMNTDIPGHVQIGFGLTKIKGIGANFSHAFCVRNNINEAKKVSDFTEPEIKDLESKLKSLKNIDGWMLNRQKDIETGEDRHVLTTDLKFNTEFDVKRMQKVRTYKGMRHSAGLPVRGQRTKAHFRHGRSMGVSKKKAGTPASVKAAGTK
jgi:small subunit ribosomal protein S13